MGTSQPRVVLVTRATELEALLAQHGTREQARFFLEARGQRIEALEQRQRRFDQALQQVSQAIPTPWRRSRIQRGDLSRFLFEPEDLVVAVGQDGLVANLAKYLTGQWVIGVNPDRACYEGILVPHVPEAVGDLLQAAARRTCSVRERTMVEARLDDGQRLLALNEVFVGHRSHQSARYRLQVKGTEARHASSGVIISTGTGATGWALSIQRQRQVAIALPRPEEDRLVYFVREPWPGKGLKTELAEGLLEAGTPLHLVSEMGEGGVIFGDGIEEDRLAFGWGMGAEVGVAKERLQCV